MFKISKEFHFSASHCLDALPTTHPCSRLHGHNYKVTLELSANVLGPTGFVKDYRELEEFKRWLDGTFDHEHLNDVLSAIQPTAELLAFYIWDCWHNELPNLTKVTVSETDKTSASYEPDK